MTTGSNTGIISTLTILQDVINDAHNSRILVLPKSCTQMPKWKLLIITVTPN